MIKAISYEEGEGLAKEYSIPFFETSAKQPLNVDKSFIKIASDVKNRLIADGPGGAQSGGHRLATGSTAKPAGGSCC